MCSASSIKRETQGVLSPLVSPPGYHFECDTLMGFHVSCHILHLASGGRLFNPITCSYTTQQRITISCFLADLRVTRSHREVLLQFAPRRRLTFGLLGQQAFRPVCTGVQALSLRDQLTPVLFYTGEKKQQTNIPNKS